jgi:hypothetical protein
VSWLAVTALVAASAYFVGVVWLAHQPVNWYLRSLADRDTHCGELRADGSVCALCGVEFVPRALPLGDPALPVSPLDPDQVCPACRGAKAAR